MECVQLGALQPKEALDCLYQCAEASSQPPSLKVCKGVLCGALIEEDQI